MIGLYKKVMVLTILVLFLGAGVLPSISGNISKINEIENFISIIKSDDDSVFLPSPDRKEKDWDTTTNPPHMFSIPEGNVGIGVNDPLVKLHVRSIGPFAIAAEGAGLAAIGGFGEGETSGVSGYSDLGVGVQGFAADGVGVMGEVNSGAAFFGRCGNGYAGIFQGDVGVIDGNVGINVIEPLAKLHVVNSYTKQHSAILAESTESDPGLFSIIGRGTGDSHGIYGESDKGIGIGGSSGDGVGVAGTSDYGVAILGQSFAGYAGQFYGSVNVTGDLEMDGNIEVSGNLEVDGEFYSEIVNVSESLNVDGGVTMPIEYVNEGSKIIGDNEYTILADSYTYLRQIWLPEAAENEGRILNIKRTGGNYDVEIGSFYGDWIDHKAEKLVLDDDMECVTLQCNGVGWFIISHYDP